MSDTLGRDYRKLFWNDPVRWVHRVLGVFLWSKQREIIESTFRKRRTVVPSCHGVGKTFVAAICVIAFMFIRRPCKVITTAPTWNQVRKLLWSEVNSVWKEHLPPEFTEMGKVLKTEIRMSDNWFAIGISPSEKTNFQGFHSENVLIVADEAPGVSEDIIDGAETLMSAGDAHFLMIGNPISKSGHFYRASRSDLWNTIHISAFDSPNFTGEPVPATVRRNLVSRVWEEERRKEWGKAHPMYIAKVLGQFPDESDRQVIPYWACERARVIGMQLAESKRLQREEETLRCIGLDVARHGLDLSAAACRRQAISYDWIYALETMHQRDLMKVAGMARSLYDREEADFINVDVVGLGAGVHDRLRQLGVRSRAIEASRRARNRKRYHLVRTEAWFHFLDWLHSGGALFDDEELIADLTGPHYEYNDRGQYVLETKEKTKKRLGRSPDRGDAAVLSVYGARQAAQGVVFQSQILSAADYLERMGVGRV